MMECSLSSLFSKAATSQLWLLSSWNVASGTEELSFKFNLVLIYFYFNSHMLVAGILDNAGTHCWVLVVSLTITSDCD